MSFELNAEEEPTTAVEFEEEPMDRLPNAEEESEESPEPQEMHEAQEAEEPEEPQEPEEAEQAQEPSESLEAEEPQEPQEAQGPQGMELDDEPQSSLAPSGTKRTKEAQEKEKLVKRPRCEFLDKAFDEISMGDVELLVRKCNSLGRKLEANADAVSQLQELQKEKKDLEKELVAVGSDDVSRVKANIAKQLLAQMTYVHAWNDELKDGRSITAFLPNVTAEMLKALGNSQGGVDNGKKRQAVGFFDSVPVKQVPVPNRKAEREEVGGTALVLASFLTFKYVKTTSELQVTATYKFGNPDKEKKPKVKGKGKGKGAKKLAEAAEDGEEAALGDDDEASPEEAENRDVAAKVIGNVGMDDAGSAVAVGGQ